MNKKEEQLLRESIRQILAQETLEEGKFTNWVADRVGIPREPSAADMSPTGKYRDAIKSMDMYTLRQDYSELYKVFRAAQGRGRTDPAVQEVIRSVRDYIVYQLRMKNLPLITATGCATEFIKSAEEKAHGDMHRADASWDRQRAWKEMLGFGGDTRREE